MRRWILLAWLACPVAAMAQGPPAPTPQPPDVPPPAVVETVDVVAVTPLHGSGLPRLHIPANIQVITAPDGASGVTDLGALLTRGTAPILASDVQGGTFQPDVQFRGFGGSPLLGASEGLAVYVDGMRANEPFGDIVNWDGLPAGAISSINVMAGSNPLFGLNALGGALSVRSGCVNTALRRSSSSRSGAVPLPSRSLLASVSATSTADAPLRQLPLPKPRRSVEGE